MAARLTNKTVAEEARSAVSKDGPKARTVPAAHPSRRAAFGRAPQDEVCGPAPQSHLSHPIPGCSGGLRSVVSARRASRQSQAQGNDRETPMDRRNFVIGSAAAALAGRSANAQDAYPSHAITLINPFPPGGAADVVGRPYAAVLEPMIKQPVVIETKSGAAGAVGAQFAATAKPDGYTLLLHIVSISGFAEGDKLL